MAVQCADRGNGAKSRINSESTVFGSVTNCVSSRLLVVLVRCFLGLAAPVFCVGASPEESAADTRPRECAQMAESYLAERLAVWQQRLSLEDWKISIVMSHPKNLPPKTVGNIRWDAYEKSAVIRVLDASDYRLACRNMLDDMEFTVVHELIHLELSSLPRREEYRLVEEFAVNQIATALLKLDRGR
jgi:hypothetical protein